jgi:hypothetical protein
MSIAVTCPSGHLLKIADSMAGRAGRCPHCREIVNVPALSPSVEAGKSSLASRSRLGKGPAIAGSPPTSAPPNAPASKPVVSSVPPAVAPDPAAADTVLMPLSEMPPLDEIALAAQQSAAEPDSPVMADAGNADPGQMAQTLPLPTAELLPRMSAAAAGSAHELGFDTAGHKARIIGSWKVLGDVEPPYVPEPGAHRAASAAATILTPVRTGPPPLPPPSPNTAPKEPLPARHESNVPDRAATTKSAWLRKPVAKDSASPSRATVYRIAAGLVLVSIFSMWPAFRYWDLGVAPGWARGVLLMALLQLAYAAWLVSIPDWASLWGMMIVLAIVATIYGTAAAMTLATPMEHEPPLGLESVRHTAPYWCGGIMLLTISAAYLCGHAAQRMRRIAGEN